MKSFKQHLKEAPAWTQSLSTMLFDLPRAGLVDLVIPLSPSIFSRVWPEKIRSTAFHLTDYDGVKKLKGMQGGKRSISAFYNMMTTEFSYGIKTEGGYVVEMEADVLVAFPDDLGSQPDKSGRRWMTLDRIEEFGGINIEFSMGRLLVEILKKNGEDVDIVSSSNVIGLEWSALGMKHGGKTKSIIIKDYIDGMEKIMKKHSKSLRSVLTDYTKKRTLEPDPDSGDTAMWDELVVNNFTIQKIHVGPEFAPDFAELVKGEGGGRMYTFANKDDDIEGFPFELYYETGDMVDYINRTLR